MSEITKFDLEQSIKDYEAMASMMAKSKYAVGEEQNINDVLHRISEIVIRRGKELGYTDEQVNNATSIMLNGYFIPGGSILAGCTDDKTRRSSLSNCYVMRLQNDSIESIFNMQRDMARTYSYRGGCGCDISALRPDGSAVHNAARTSTGAVSFMPLFSITTETIGQNSRRGALLLSIDVRHPDVMRFIWAKADPERVFTHDFLNKSQDAKLTLDLLNAVDWDSLTDENRKLLTKIRTEVSRGKLPSIDGANVSIRLTDEFMKAVEEDKPWVCLYPDIDDDREAYENEWRGGYESWQRNGHKFREYDTYNAHITLNNASRFLGHTIEWHGNFITLDEDFLNEQLIPGLEACGGLMPIRAKIPTAKQIMYDLCLASWIRGDPGVFFFDTIRNYTTMNDLHPKLELTCSNPCFSGDTKVLLADGRGPVSLHQLAAEGKDVPVYTRDLKSGAIKIKMGRAPRVTANNVPMLRIHFDNGSYIDVTENHPFPLQDDRTVEAKDLVIGDVFYPLTRKLMSYDEVILNKDTKAKANSKYWWVKGEKKTPHAEHHLIYDFFNPGQRIPGNGQEIHHKNENRLDNRPENLELLTSSEHAALHAEEMRGEKNWMAQHPETSLFNDPEWQQKIREEYHIGATRSVETCQRISEKAQERWGENGDAEWQANMREQVRQRLEKNRDVVMAGYRRHMEERAAELQKQTDLPVIIETLPDGCSRISVVKTCETCGKQFTVAWVSRTRACCSLSCAIRHPATQEKRAQAMAPQKAARIKMWEAIKKAQVLLINQLKRMLGRDPAYKEFKEAADKEGIVSRINGMRYGFGSYNNLLTAASDANHAVVKIEKLPPQDSYNISIDDTHQMYVMTDFGDGNEQNFVLSWNCSEIFGADGQACNLGAHLIHKYVINPWTENAKFDMELWKKHCKYATILQNIFSNINESMHPLEKQREMDRFGKRIGIEFTGLGDAISMLNMNYGNKQAIEFTKQIMKEKVWRELETSAELAMQFGPCDYYKEAEYDPINTLLNGSFIEGIELPEEIKNKIRKAGGLRNVSINTVGPTGSISIMAGNCSSGIEPVFAIFYTRRTRVGDRQEYNVCHIPVARHLLEHWEKGRESYTIEEIKQKYHVTEAYELNYSQRIEMQKACQQYCDSSISSTVNLPNDCSVEDIMDVYMAAWKNGLKGITVFRDGCITGVLEVKKDKKDSKKEKKEDLAAEVDKCLDDIEKVDPDLTQAIYSLEKSIERSKLKWGDVIEIGDKIQSYTHTVHWRGAKFYVIVSTDDEKRPMQMFISSLPRAVAMNDKGEFNNDAYHNQLSNWSALMRMISIALRGGVPAKAVVKQLRKSSFTMTDMMAVIARVLDEYTGAHNQTEEEIQAGLTECPECHKHSLRHEGGCATCQECGYSRCG